MKSFFRNWLQQPHAFERAIYAGLSFCHVLACVLTDKPHLYGPLALLYLMLCVKGK